MKQRTLLIEHDESILYARAQILAWANGELLNVLDDNSLRRVIDVLSYRKNRFTANECPVLIINCTGITRDATSQDCWTKVFHLVPNLCLVLSNCDPRIANAIRLHLPQLPENNNPSDRYYLFAQSSSGCNCELGQVANIEKDFVLDRVKKCYVSFDSSDLPKEINTKNGFGLLRSTKMWASGYFDATRLLGDPFVFPWVVSVMADEVKPLVERLTVDQNGFTPEVRLLACTRNGAVLAASIRRMLPDAETIDLDVVERFAPNNAVVEFYDGTSQTRHRYLNPHQSYERYLFVGDFVIGGTEIKLASLHGIYRAIPLEAAVVLGNVLDLSYISDDSGSETLTPAKNSGPIVRSLFSLKKEIRPEIEYRFPDV